MRSATLNRTSLVVLASVVLAGCASPAPDLPRYVSQASEAGFVATNKTTGSAPQIRVTKAAIESLTADEQKQLRAMDGLQILADDQYGLIIDVQSVDQSTAGTSGGAAVGGALASAGYVDRALRGGNYSAVNQLALGLLGAVAGSSLDSAPTSKFEFRYAVKMGDGDIKYFDETKSTAFRHVVGVCVLLPALELVTHRVCNQTGDAIRKLYLKAVP